MRRLVLLALVVTLAAPVVAAAQIYVKRDEHGVLVLSDRPLGDGALTFEVPRSTGLRVTRAAAPGTAARYADVIEQHASRHHVRPELVRAVIQVESGFNPYARSHKGAMGLMQLMPQTAADYGVVDAYNPTENIRAGVAYLRALLDRYSGNEELALAAYNAGPGAVERYGQQVPPYRETRDYVRKIKGRTGGALAASRAPVFVYKIVEIVEGRPIPRYSNVRPSSGPYEVVRSFN
jgi:hypothetical protein